MFTMASGLLANGWHWDYLYAPDKSITDSKDVRCSNYIFEVKCPIVDLITGETLDMVRVHDRQSGYDGFRTSTLYCFFDETKRALMAIPKGSKEAQALSKELKSAKSAAHKAIGGYMGEVRNKMRDIATPGWNDNPGVAESRPFSKRVGEETAKLVKYCKLQDPKLDSYPKFINVHECERGYDIVLAAVLKGNQAEIAARNAEIEATEKAESGE